MTNAELLRFLFETPLDEADEARETLTGWIGQGRRFQAFVVENRGKVRKKLRLAQTSENVQSVLVELDIARHLVEDARCRVGYEADGHAERSPDLTVTFRTRTVFHLEATRVQMAQADAEGRADKLIRVVCNKLGQAVPQNLNCLVVATVGGALTEEEANAAVKTLKRRVEGSGGPPAYIPFRDPSSFYKQFRWLSAIVLCGAEPGGSPQTVVWANPQAGRSLPPDIRTLLQALSLGSEDR